MSFLYPFFLLGGAAIAAPILLHLIRRVSKQKKVFSTLMFLKPSPPPLTRKSRIEHWFLLLLRCLLLLLTALAFSRPYLSDRQSVELETDERVRHCLLLDRSASMQRDGAWEDALAKVQTWLERWQDDDYATVLLFDEGLETVVSFSDWARINQGARTQEVMKRLRSASPGWGSTAIDTALLESLNRLEDASKERQQDTEQQAWQLVVISDLQAGSRYEGLRGQDWPKHAHVVFETVNPTHEENAGIQALQAPWQVLPDDNGMAPRVRISNAIGATTEQFQLRWGGPTGPASNIDPLPMYVTPNQSRIVTAPPWPETTGADHLMLSGDLEPFDNTIWIAPYKPKQSRIMLLSPEDPKSNSELVYYLRRAFQSIPGHRIDLLQTQPQSWDSMASMGPIDLWIVTQPLDQPTVDGLKVRLNQGATVLMPLADPTMEQTLQTLWNRPSLQIQEAQVDDYALFGKIDFKHPLFAPFSSPRFSDFTKIHFWGHRSILDLPEETRELEVPARFDSGEPAIITRQMGEGRMVILTSSWTPRDSQLALSTKFVPWLYTILNWGRNHEELRTQYTVGETVDLSSIPNGQELTIENPSGRESAVDNNRIFSATSMPGIYTIQGEQGFNWIFAVNIAPSESRTSPLPLEVLEGLGIPTRRSDFTAPQTPATRQEELEEARLLQAQEIEEEQQYWRWTLMGVLALVLVESVVAAKASRLKPA
ncbi:BatA domain-containing protein [Verrucomicrobia bacterium]|nr:BatA domain-containing protein [Verrucomicrobiota bacterium]